MSWPGCLAVLWICSAVTVTAVIEPVVPLGLAVIAALFLAWEGE